MPTPSRTLPRALQLQAYVAAFEDRKTEAIRLAAGADEERFNTPPAPGRWSAAACVAHLTTTGTLLLPGLDAAIARGRAQGRVADGPFRYGPVSRWFIRAVSPEGRPIKTFRVFQPPPQRFAKEQTLADFLALQDAMIARIHDADGLDLKHILVPSAATRLLWISLGAWFEATIAHEERHLRQARRALENA